MAASGVADGWHYELDGTEYGPVSSSILKRMARTGKLTADARVRRQSDARWVAAGSIKGLFNEDESRSAPSIPRDGLDGTALAGGTRISDWGLASVLTGCTLLVAQNSIVSRIMLFEVRMSLTEMLILAVSKLILLAGIGFSLFAGIYGWTAARKNGGGLALPVAGVVVASMAASGWLFGVIAVIRVIDGGK